MEGFLSPPCCEMQRTLIYFYGQYPFHNEASEHAARNICWPRRHKIFNFHVVTAGSVVRPRSNDEGVQTGKSFPKNTFVGNCVSCFSDEGRALPCTAEHWSPPKCCDYERELWSVRMGERLFSFVITLNRLKHKKAHFYSNLICTSLKWVVHAQREANLIKPLFRTEPWAFQTNFSAVRILDVIVCWDRQQHTKTLPPGVVHSFRVSNVS